VSRSRVSRRDFLRLAGAASVAGALGNGLGVVSRAAAAEAGWDHEVDVAVVGGGAAGAVAAVFAHEGGASTMLLEKSFLVGGTTAKSGGVYWIPNNRFLRERGTTEDRQAMLARMARHSYPQFFAPDAERFGLPPGEYALIERYYDKGAEAVDELERVGALVSMPADGPFGPMPDYFEEATGDAVPVDRRLWPKKPDGSFGLGDEMMRQLKQALEDRGIPIALGHRATRLVRDESGRIVGLEAAKMDGSTVRVRARRGVIFGSGGYTHNRELVLHYQPGPVFGGCAVPTNEGDFIYMATAAGAKLAQMHGAWRAQIVLEQALQFSSTPDDVFMPPGDSTILVNRDGQRVVNETANYNERTRVHYVWDPVTHSWPNMLLFMIYDRRGAELYGGRFPIPAPGTQAPYVIEGANRLELTRAIQARLAKLAGRTGGFTLSDHFMTGLAANMRRFNGFAESGNDEDFGRGRMLYDRLWHSRVWSYPNPGTDHELGSNPNPTMHPMAEDGPYYCIILAPGTLDTNGGPMIDAQARVLDSAGQPIPGLWGAGNCVGAPTGNYYYGGGGTLGPAVTFGYLAGRNAAAATGADDDA
jgi:3-oxosteroid 1-dehydrogenase